MKKSFLIIFILPWLLSGCLNLGLGTKKPPVTDGGIYRSQDKAETFEQINNLATVGGQKNFNTDSTVFLQFDPTDNSTLYFSGRESGLLVSYDNGNSWRSILKNKGTVTSLLVNPQSACELYAATKQTIFKSLDCGRKWNEIYIEKVPKRSIIDILIDHNQTNRLLMGLSDGSIILSEDSGFSWKVWSRSNQVMKEFYLNPQDSSRLYLTTGKSFFRSTDQGLSWESLDDIIVKDFEFKGGNQVQSLQFIAEVNDGFFTISAYGILKSLDGGTTWEELPLLPLPKKENILSLTVNPDNMNELYYSTRNAIYYSADGGVNWKTIKSPTSKYNHTLLMHPNDHQVIYLGTYTPPEK